MPTPSELNKIKAAVADAAAALLARDTNADLTAEELAEELAESMIDSMVETYEAIQAKSYNLVVVASFKEPDGHVHTAAVGPLSTRAQQRARDVGERFAWDYKTRKGTGRYTLVPLVRNPNEAWDTARAQGLVEFEHHLLSVIPGETPGYEPMRFDLTEPERARISAEAQWQMDPGLLARLGPGCTCGLDTSLLKEQGKYFLCPRHPEENRD